MKTVTIGTGITAFEREQSETPGERRARILEASRRKGDEFEFTLAAFGDVEAWAKSTLDGATDEAIAAEHSSLEWYAHLMLKYLRVVRADIVRGDAAGAAATALRLGDLLTEARMKFQFEKAALVGLNSVAHAQRAADVKHESAASLTKQIANLYKHFAKMNPNVLADVIYQQIRAKVKSSHPKSSDHQISNRTLQTHLALARKAGLIPKRHPRA